MFFFTCNSIYLLDFLSISCSWWTKVRKSATQTYPCRAVCLQLNCGSDSWTLACNIMFTFRRMVRNAVSSDRSCRSNPAARETVPHASEAPTAQLYGPVSTSFAEPGPRSRSVDATAGAAPLTSGRRSRFNRQSSSAPTEPTDSERCARQACYWNVIDTNGRTANVAIAR